MDYALYKKIIHNATSLKSIVELKVTCKMPYFECETDIKFKMLAYINILRTNKVKVHF